MISLVLAVLTFAAYYPVTNAEFINFDDHQYVVDNPHLTGGLKWENVKWAVTTGYASNWHPLTWFSHMCDVQMYGLRPRGHHVTNLVLHISNTLLLFFVLWRMTSRLWPSATVAALFGVHPLHVESVAWVAERKDVLSTFFFLLTIGAYVAYVRTAAVSQADDSVRPSTNLPSRWKRYAFYSLSLVLFALGLMSKPMLVTLPFLLLLLDWWPIERLSSPPIRFNDLLRLAAEKVPFLLLAATSSALTFYAQQGSHSVTTGLPLRLRLANAVVSYIKYAGKTFWPANLAIFYPHPDTRYGLSAKPGYPVSEQWNGALVLAGLVALAAVSFLALRRARREPWFFTAWFWFLGTLVPVIGIVQVGMQGLADRYMYIPSIGLFVVIVWAGCHLGNRLVQAKPFLQFGVVATILACAGLAYKQTGYWHDNFRLFEHAMTVTRHNPVAECNVGEEWARRGKLPEAQELFTAAQLADPRYPMAYMDLGLLFELQAKPELAVTQYEATVQLRPWNEASRVRLAYALKTLGRRDESLEQFKQLEKLNPGNATAHYEAALILASENKVSDALVELNQALQIRPNFADALLQMGTLLAGQGRFSEAERPLRAAIALSPTNAALHLELGKALMLDGKSSDAAPEFALALQLEPNLPQKLLSDGRDLVRQGQLNAALVRFNTALWLQPNAPDAMSELAWILATHPAAQFRNAARAIRLAQHAVQLSGGTQARPWAALDVAFAEAGRFPEAISAAEKSRDLSLAAGDSPAAQACDERITLYQAQHPFRQ
jgi:protein O-mannosyl-transferase